MLLLGERECQKLVSSLSTSMTTVKMEPKTHQNLRYTSKSLIATKHNKRDNRHQWIRCSSIRNKCIHCRGNHAPGSCPTKTRPQVTPNAAGYQTYDNSAVAGKANTNDLPSFSSKNGQPTAANMTPSSPRNLAGVQRHPSCTQEP